MSIVNNYHFSTNHPSLRNSILVNQDRNSDSPVFLIHLPGESPLSSLLIRDRLTSPSSSARRQLFSPGSQAQKRGPIPIAPKPPQGGVTVTPINKLLSTALQLQYLQQQQAQINQQLQGGGAQPQGTSTQESVSTQTTSVASPTSPAVVSMASAGTQTSPIRPLAPVNFQSPTKPISVASVAEIMNTASVSPDKITVGSLLSPGALRQAAAASNISLSPPMPSVTITPSPSPLKTPQRGSLPATPNTAPQSTPPRPKKTGSLALFYRKLYQLAFIRIRDLCDRLGLDKDVMQK